ncbi:unnamed protein product [Nezara viridula]|uniref:Uncharacterized protein n=1 Tax=Nezara viridula TaxID=85310 RepID=A0A9P0DZY5_NEZVI|nr:unnamed protein product [Nezara viridula]
MFVFHHELLSQMPVERRWPPYALLPDGGWHLHAPLDRPWVCNYLSSSLAVYGRIMSGRYPLSASSTIIRPLTNLIAACGTLQDTANFRSGCVLKGNVVYAEMLEVKILKKRLIMVKLCRDINIGGEVASCDREQSR